MDRFTELDQVLGRVWSRLEAAANQPGHPLRTMTFGTLEGEAPRLRTVILRAVSSSERRLAFHTDRRSQKIVDLRSNPRIAWHSWDSEAREQLHLRGRASVHLDDTVADKMWAEQDPASLDVFARSQAPGRPLEEPGDGLPSRVKTEPVKREDVKSGRRHFAVVRTIIDEIDWLHLHPDRRRGHYRAQFRFARDAQGFEGTWVMP